jgi:tripeptidyl-peptidase-1
MFRLQALLVALCAIVVTATNFGKYVRMESDISVFSGPHWIKGERVTNEDMITIRFALRHDSYKVEQFEELFLDISNPQSVNFGKWLSAAEVAEKLAPSERNVAIVKEFLESFGVTKSFVNLHGDIIRAEISATLAEKMFQTVMHKFTYVDSSATIIRVIQPYHLPEDLAEVVSFVDDLIRFPRLRTTKISPVEESSEVVGASAWTSCGSSYSSYVNPAVLQSRYGYPTLTSSATGNSVAVVEFQNQYYDNTDLASFSSTCGLSSAITVTTDIGTNNQAYCTSGILSRCVESLLDIEYIGAVAGQIPLSVYYYSSYSLLAWIEDVSNAASPPLVQSVSYGNDEAQQTGADYIYTVNNYFASVGSRGISILFASGDQGVWGREGTGSVFHPDFPAGSPYVTAVGGTDFATATTIGTETTWADGGGGFSNYFAIPSYQSTVVATFKATSTNLPASSYYNNSGRGYPDVSALAGTQNAYLVSIKGGKYSAVGGTSAASPVVAGIFAQLNDVRLNAGKSSLGFLNQFIYQNPSAFNDVTSGTNNDGTNPGFTAIAGWDPATGLGTPIYSKLAAAALTF